MELIYIWVEDLFPFEKHTSIKLSNRFDITPNVDLDAKSIKLGIKDNKDFIHGFFGDRVGFKIFLRLSIEFRKNVGG